MAKKETLKKNKKGGTSATTSEKANKTVGKDSSMPGATSAPGLDSAVTNASLDRTQMTAEQYTQAQIEQAIKESSDPGSKLKKLRSPLSVKGCLLNLLILIVLSVAIILLITYIMLDKETFDLMFVVKDMFNKFGITQLFTNIGNWFKKIFSGGKNIVLLLAAMGII